MEVTPADISANANINLPTYKDYIKKLSEVSGIDIKTSDDVIAALIKRLDFFIENGCRASVPHSG